MALDTLNSPTATASNSFNRDRNRNQDNKSKRQRLDQDTLTNPSCEEEYLALCLLTLARGRDRDFDHDRKSSPPLSPFQPLSPLFSDQQQVYKCSLCGKSFLSYQALGGHKTSHRKTVSFITNGVDQSTVINNGNGLVCQTVKTHTCSVCFKTFSSGQALGGHKRCHYDRNGNGNDNGNGNNNGNGEDKSVVSLRFDLNLPADEVGEEKSQLTGVDSGEK